MNEPGTRQPTARAGTGRAAVALCCVATLLYWISQYLYVPTLPTYVQSKSENLAMVGVVLSMYGLWQAIIRLPLGIASDWMGRRKFFVVIGMALAGAGAWTMGTASGADGLLLGRALTGLAAGTWVPLVVFFSGFFPADQAVRASALLTLIGSVGRVFATGITGSLNELGGYSLAFSLAAGTAILATLVFLAVPETRHPPKRPAMGQVGRLLTRRDVLLPSLLSLVGQYAHWATTFGFMPILARQLGGDDVALSLLVSMSVAVYTVGNLAATAVGPRMGPRRLLYACFALLSAGIAGAAAAPSLWALFGVQAAIGLAMGVSYPVLMGMSIQRVAEGERTTAMGLHQAVYAVGMFAGPWLSGLLADYVGIRSMFGCTALLCLVLGLVGTRWLGEGRR